MSNGRIILAGGSGFLGRALALELARQGREVFVLSRAPKSASGRARQVGWDGHSTGGWARLLEGAEAVVNLAGRSVNCRYTPANRREIVASRVKSVETLGARFRRAPSRRRFWCRPPRSPSTATRGGASATRPRPQGQASPPRHACAGRRPSTRWSFRRREKFCCASASLSGAGAALSRRSRGSRGSTSAARSGAAGSTSVGCTSLT
ncbi:MAG: NAD-dependent epimerase/dehydratase family protein [Acidobacteria bacterium]|nr:NAD-dependent epimerase/dehydratase family protein [Acidobacteriota bacterium]